MDVSLALLADYANVSQEGKLNVMGIFDRILTPAFPAVHPEMRLVVYLKASPAERGRVAQLQIRLLDADGKVLQQMAKQITVPHESLQPTVVMNQIIIIQQMGFERPGHYAFSILIDNDEKATVPFSVEQLGISR